MIRSVLCLTVSFILHLSLSSNPEKSACYIREENGKNGYRLICIRNYQPPPADEARPLELDINAESHLHLESDNRNCNLSVIIENITTIVASYPHHHLHIGSGTFARFPNLTSLELISSSMRDLGEIRTRLTIPADGFRDAPKLRSISIHAHVLSESTIEALGTLKDQVRALYLKATSPVAAILEQVSKFAKLESVSLIDICGKRQLPKDIFKKSSSTLREIIVDKCDMPKIMNDTFGSMPNLTLLKWIRSNITAIEPGAFDGMPNLESLIMTGNDLDTLPHGLFRNNKKLKLVHFEDTFAMGLTRDNFTHLENFAELDFGKLVS